MTLSELQSLLTSGEFHHATYRNKGSLWEGLWIYRKDEKSSRGFDTAGCFNRAGDPADNQKAYELVAHTGVSVGAYGEG